MQSRIRNLSAIHSVYHHVNWQFISGGLCITQLKTIT